MKIKMAALISTIGTALGTIGSVWTAGITIRAVTSIQPGWKWSITPVLIAASLLDASLPMFYFGLHRSMGAFNFPKWFRTTALVVACAFGAALCMDTLKFVRFAISPTASQSLSLIAGLCCAALLLQVYRQGNVKDHDHSLFIRSGPIFAITKTAAFWGGFLIATACLQVLATPFVYAVVRHIASGNGRPSPHFTHILVQSIERLTNTLCLWITPWVVYRIRTRAAQPAPATDELDTISPAETA